MKIDFFKYSDKGARQYNQDRAEAIALKELFFACVADGVGGHSCGEVAAEESVLTFVAALTDGDTDLKNIILAADERLKLLQATRTECHGMATTFTGCTISGNTLKMIHAGDSRLCILRKNELFQLSENHTEVELLLRTGKITAQEAEVYPRRNVILSALGIYGSPMIQEAEFELISGDTILITSDGIHEIVSPHEFIELSQKGGNVQVLGESIIELLTTKRITDNVTLVAISVI